MGCLSSASDSATLTPRAVNHRHLLHSSLTGVKRRNNISLRGRDHREAVQSGGVPTAVAGTPSFGRLFSLLLQSGTTAYKGEAMAMSTRLHKLDSNHIFTT